MKNRPLIAIDILALIAFLALLLSTIVFRIFATGLARTSSFLGLGWPAWLSIHKYSGYALIILILIHLLSHWSWIRAIPRLWKTKI